MHRAVAAQSNPKKLFVTVPWSVAFKNRADEGYVLSAASDIAVKVQVNTSTGEAAIQTDPADATHVLQIPTGKNPRGIVINAADSRAYVMNYISRDVTVIDIASYPEKAIATLRSTAAPAAGSFEDLIQIGKELYNSSTGEFDPPAPGGQPVTGRMSNNGWGSCASCHPNGLSDNVVWLFGAGPRRTISQYTDFDITDSSSQRALNWSGIFDEEEDFEANIRGTSGGPGLIVSDDGVTPATPLVGLGTPPSGGRKQLKLRGVNAWDAIKAYIQFGIRPPISPVSKDDPEVAEGEQIFRQNNCQKCHGGSQWTASRITPPVPAGDISGGQVIGQLSKVGTFDSTAKKEVRATAAAPLGPDGYAPPSLMFLFAFPQTFYHNGCANSLDQVLENVPHRSAGSGNDQLQDSEQRRKLVMRRPRLFILDFFRGAIAGQGEPMSEPCPGCRSGMTGGNAYVTPARLCGRSRSSPDSRRRAPSRSTLRRLPNTSGRPGPRPASPGPPARRGTRD